MIHMTHANPHLVINTQHASERGHMAAHANVEKGM